MSVWPRWPKFVSTVLFDSLPTLPFCNPKAQFAFYQILSIVNSIVQHLAFACHLFHNLPVTIKIVLDTFFWRLWDLIASIVSIVSTAWIKPKCAPIRYMPQG